MSTTFPELPSGRSRRLLELLVVAQFVGIVGLTVITSTVVEPARGVTPPFPQPTLATFSNGTYATEVESWTQQHLPAIAELKAMTLTVHFLLGIEETSYVKMPVAGWTFATRTLAATPAVTDLTERRVFLRQLEPRIAEFDGEVWVMVVPDKGRIYPDIAWPAGEYPSARREWFDTLLADLESVGIRTVDPRAELRAARVLYPLSLVYARTDTHWNATGASLGARLLTQRLPLERLAPERPARTHIEWLHDQMSQSDLNANARGFALGALGAWLRERVDSLQVYELSSDGELRARTQAIPAAQIAVAGDSFCAKLVPAFVALAPFAVDTTGVVPATNPWRRLDAMLTRIEAGELQPELLVLIGSEWQFSAQPSDPARLYR